MRKIMIVAVAVISTITGATTAALTREPIVEQSCRPGQAVICQPWVGGGTRCFCQ